MLMRQDRFGLIKIATEDKKPEDEKKIEKLFLEFVKRTKA